MEPTLFDSHCHPQFPQYDPDRDAVIDRALKNGIGMVCVGTDLNSSAAAIKLAERYDGLYASVGLHPNDALEEAYTPEVAAAYADLLHHEKVVAVGEIGLDYYRTESDELKHVQRARFEEQLQMAQHARLPAIIHCRDAHGDMRRILGAQNPPMKPTRRDDSSRGVIHSFTGTWEDAQAYLNLGYSIGLNGIITFAREYDEVVKKTPLERILLETDAPFLTPVPFRGKRNQPSYIIEVAKKVAELKGTDLSEVEKVTTANVLSIFINKH